MLALMRNFGIALATALLLSGCTVPAPEAPTDLPPIAASTPSRDISKAGAATNTCVDELHDNSASVGIDLDSVSIGIDAEFVTVIYVADSITDLSQGSTFLIPSYSSRHSHNTEFMTFLEPMGTEVGSVPLFAFLSSRGYTLSTWNAETGDEPVHGGSFDLDGKTATIKFPISLIANLSQPFAWSASVEFADSKRDFCPQKDSKLTSAF